MKKTIVLIPAFEPDGKMLALEEELYAAGFGIVIVDDGSGPAFKGIFEQAGRHAEVVSYERNRGKGHALRTGLLKIMEGCGPACTIVTADADGQHGARDVIRAAGEAADHPDCLILGSRRFTGKVPFKSRAGNSITRLVFRSATGVPVTDTQTGLRAFDSGLVPFLLGIRGERYEYEMNVLIETAKRRVPIREISIDTIYLDKNASSHFHPVRDSFLIYRDLLKFTASSFASFCLDYLMFLLFSAIFSGAGTAAAGAGIANICARVVSAGFNYTVNRKFVFRDRSNPARTLIGYILLASGILLFNTVLLEFLITEVGMNRYAAKILTEITFFILSFVTQKFVVFGKMKEVAA